MPVQIVIGLQWGDEGKGKVVDVLAASAQHVVRAHGGHNAGHTVLAEGKEWAFHLMPSGVLHPNTLCYLGSGMVIYPDQLQKEAEALKIVDRLFLSPYAHIITDEQIKRDQQSEQAAKIGTTGRGIGPCYTDKVSRLGLRAADCPHPFVKKCMAPVEEMLHAAVTAGEEVLLEGAQGSLLDITYGTYPFVTSSSTLSAGVCLGAGLPPTAIDRVVGVIKAFQTRVGHGPFPTEDHFVDAKAVREVGTTTQRVRRLGWFDAPLARFACQLNGVGSLAITKLDVLDRLDEIKVCTHYRHQGKNLSLPPPNLSDVEPVYEILPGWKKDTTQVTSFDELPQNAKRYIEFIETQSTAPIEYISNGPDRSQFILRARR